MFAHCFTQSSLTSPPVDFTLICNIMLPRELGQGLGEVVVSQPVIQLSMGRELHTPPSGLWEKIWPQAAQLASEK